MRWRVRERDAVWDGEWARERRGLRWSEQERDETKEIESERETKDTCSHVILKFQIKFLWKLSLWKTTFTFLKVSLWKTTFTFLLHPNGKKWSRQKIKNEKFGQKVSLQKTIFTFKIVFHKDDFELVHISNKHHKSHVWP